MTLRLAFLALAATLGAVLVWWLVSRSVLCHHWVPSLVVRGDSGVISDDGRRAYLVIRTEYYRQAMGICAFPDGGSTIYVGGGTDFFAYDFERDTLTPLASFEYTDRLSVGIVRDHIRFTHRSPGRLYATVSGQRLSGPAERNEWERVSLRYEVDTSRGSARAVSDEEYERLTATADPIGRIGLRIDEQGRYVVFKSGPELWGHPYSFRLLRRTPPSGPAVRVEELGVIAEGDELLVRKIPYRRGQPR